MSGGGKKRFQDWRKMFRNRKERFRPGRRWLAIVLLPAIPATAAGVMSGNRDIFWGQLAVEFYALFLLTAICSRDFAAVYQNVRSIWVSLVLRSSEIIRFGMVHSSMILSSVSINVCICSGVPMVMRSQFWMRGASKWRTRMPFFFNSL